MEVGQITKEAWPNLYQRLVYKFTYSFFLFSQIVCFLNLFMKQFCLLLLHIAFVGPMTLILFINSCSNYELKNDIQFNHYNSGIDFKEISDQLQYESNIFQIYIL